MRILYQSRNNLHPRVSRPYRSRGLGHPRKLLSVYQGPLVLQLAHWTSPIQSKIRTQSRNANTGSREQTAIITDRCRGASASSERPWGTMTFLRPWFPPTLDLAQMTKATLKKPGALSALARGGVSNPRWVTYTNKYSHQHLIKYVLISWNFENFLHSGEESTIPIIFIWNFKVIITYQKFCKEWLFVECWCLSCPPWYR